MALKDTIATMKKLLNEVLSDLDKSTNGNKAASQRVRTGTIKFEKIAKLYRKESVAEGKKAPKKKGAKKAKAMPKAKKAGVRKATAKVVRKKRK